MNDLTRISSNVAVAPAVDATVSPSATLPGPRFDELLERLQQLAAQQRDAAEVDTPEQLQDALRTADDGFVAAMDLRRQLEAAFARHMP